MSVGKFAPGCNLRIGVKYEKSVDYVFNKFSRCNLRIGVKYEDKTIRMIGVIQGCNLRIGVKYEKGYFALFVCPAVAIYA